VYSPDVAKGKKGKGRYSSSWEPISELRDVTCHMESHSVTWHK